MADGGSVQGIRLQRAVTAAFAPLAGHGFQVRDTQSGWDRGASVVVASGSVTIVVDADFLECELSVKVQVAGARPVPVEDLVPAVRGVVRRRLPRDATRGVLQSRLGAVVNALLAQAPEVLRGGDEGVSSPPDDADGTRAELGSVT
jgi:hypothetical protein